MTGPDYKPPYRLMYFGLAFGALGNVGVIAMWADGRLDSFFPVGNLVAILVTIGGGWLIRQREKGRL